MPDLPVLSWVSTSRPKPGNAGGENEDATALDAGALRFAVADGATEAWQSGGWASHLAAEFVRRPPTPGDFPAWLTAARGGWTPPAAGTAWYVEVKQEQGSFATLLGLEFRQPKNTPGLTWKAVAIGDSCLLVLRGGRFEVAFPLATVSEFGSRPALVPSSTEVRCPKPEWLAGRAEPGDLFILATDAVARYLLSLPSPADQNPLLLAIHAGAATKAPEVVLESLLGLNDALNDDASIIAVLVPKPPEPSR
jgi:hypothetical protein